MEDFCMSAPCLLDDLMDNEIIKCDIDFGFPLPVQTDFAVKGSPSHESDSGCSDMSEIRSVSTSSENDFDPIDIFMEDADEELANYFTSSTNVQNPQAEISVKSVSTSERINIIQNIVRVKVPSPEIDVDSDSDYEPNVSRVQTRGKSVIHKKASTSCKKVDKSIKEEDADLCVLPASGKVLKSIDTNGRLPAVKVVKVIKAPPMSTKKDIDDQLWQALDDRNKKNAVQAKINREKKKAYTSDLENEIEKLRSDNFSLKQTNKKVLKEKNALSDEVDYLRSVLANDSALSGLLKNIGTVTNLKLSSAFSRKRSAAHDHDYESPSKRGKSTSSTTAGVCLHVDQGNVSLEFCSKCANMAKAVSSDEEDNS